MSSPERDRVLELIRVELKRQAEAGEMTGQNAGMNWEGAQGMNLEWLKSYAERLGLEVPE